MRLQTNLSGAGNVARSITAALLTGTVLFVLGAALAAARPLGPEFDSYVEKTLRDWGAPGVMISVVKDGKSVFAGGYGVVKAGESRRVDRNTLCPIMSNTKVFAATAVAMLVDEGKLSWDDPVVKYLPDFRLLDPWVTEKVTIRDALSHRAGLPSFVGKWEDPDYTRNTLVGALRYCDPTSGFRESFFYSNMGYVIAGQIIERLTGKTWEQFVRERIFTPLGMTASYTSFAELGDASRHENLFPRHTRKDGVITPLVWTDRHDLYAAAGGVITTADDIAKWMRFRLGDGTFEGKRLVSPERMADIETPNMLIDIPWARTIYCPTLHFAVYDLGLTSYDYRGRKVDEHLGGDINSIVAFIPEENLSVAVCSNAAFGNSASLRMVSAIKLKAIDTLLDAPETDWSATFQDIQRKADADLAAAKQPKKTAPSLPLAQYAGTYADPLRGPVRIAQESGKLVLHYRAGYTGDLEPLNGDTFRVVWRESKKLAAEISFRVNGGRPEALVWRNLGEFRRK